MPRAYTIDRICSFFDDEFDGVFLENTDEKGITSRVDSKVLKKVLEKSTKSNFLYNKKVYTQVDGVQMGSPLGPTLANWFLGDIENNIFSII